MDPYDRRIVPTPIAWFNDLYQRDLLDLSPPYQRRSVWNQAYREYFIETILLNYPAPPVFLHEEISPEGTAAYSVVDGKQRLTTILDFVRDIFPVGENSSLERLQGRFFSQLDDATKTAFWRYPIGVEYMPIVEEGVLKNIFDRLNRNVARLTRQELRHAQYAGELAKSAEAMTDYMLEELPRDVPRIAAASRRQMKDVELVAQLLLLAEEGPASFSQDELDDAYVAREEWSVRTRVERRFRNAVEAIAELVAANGGALMGTRVQNQADFYSLFGAVLELQQEKKLPAPEASGRALARFLKQSNDETAREKNEDARMYYEAARSASNDLRQRRTRIEILKKKLSVTK